MPGCSFKSRASRHTSKFPIQSEADPDSRGNIAELNPRQAVPNNHGSSGRPNHNAYPQSHIPLTLMSYVTQLYDAITSQITRTAW